MVLSANQPIGLVYEHVEFGENHVKSDHEQNGDQFVCVSCMNVGLD